LLTPVTPARWRTLFAASWRWNCHSTSPDKVSQPPSTITLTVSACKELDHTRTFLAAAAMSASLRWPNSDSLTVISTASAMTPWA
jgi:hypothetical protein